MSGKKYSKNNKLSNCCRMAQTERQDTKAFEKQVYYAGWQQLSGLESKG
jgi:hypothetical protein